ncbi:MAG: R3H domain-containing nucleic acid-binding protein [Patescibacteria group bacterium]|nr:R3H domain-containing nucleic acid-binding protein [Patescibacteria group bacterium]
MQNEKSKLKKAEEITNDFFKKMSFEVEIELGAIKENVLSLNLQSSEPQILIGEKGWTLIEIQKILGKILRKKLGEQIFLDLDVCQYKKKKIEYLKGLAQGLADQVSLQNQEKILPAMSSYERRIIHLTLSQREDVITESVGEEPKRQVVIRPRHE